MLFSRIISCVVLSGSVLLLGACATSEPVVPPTELRSIKVQSKLDRLWSFSLPKAKKGRFEPLPMGGLVYAASRSGEVVALDQATGKLKWKRKLDTALSTGVGGNNDRVFVTSSDGVVIALSADQGKVLWEKPASSEVLTPVSAGFGNLIVRSADGRMLSLDPATGEERWSSTYTPPALTLNGYSRPLLLDGGVLVGLDDGRLLALSSEDGGLLWESVLSVASGRSEIERLVDIDGSIRVDNDAIYAANYQGNLARIEPVKGQIIWSVPASSTAGVAISESVVVVVGEEDTIQAFDKANGQLLWTQEAMKHRRLTAPTLIGKGKMLIGDVEGYLHIIDTADGSLIGRTRAGKKSIYPELALTNDAIYSQSADGKVVAYKKLP